MEWAVALAGVIVAGLGVLVALATLLLEADDRRHLLYAAQRLDVSTTLLLAVERYREAIHRQREDQRRQADLGTLVGTAYLPEVRPELGEAVGRAKLACDLALPKQLLTPAFDLQEAAESLGKFAYIAPRDGGPFPAPSDPEGWSEAIGRYWSAYDDFGAIARGALAADQRTLLDRLLRRPAEHPDR